MATIVDYQYIPEVSTLDALHNLASDTTNGYSQDLPGVNTFLINGANQITNIPEGEGGSGIAGWSTNVSWYSILYNKIGWSSGYIYLPDGTSISISSGTANISSVTYIYYDQSDGSVHNTTLAYKSVGEGKILLCVASPTSSGKDCSFQAFGTNKQSTFITADNIAANTITGNEIAANSIKAAQIDSGAITADKIDVGAVTASKITVGKLSDIDNDLGSITAGSITGTTITAGSTSGAAVRLDPNNYRIEFYYGGSMVGYMAGGSVDGNGGILINTDVVGMVGRDLMDLGNAKLRIPVGTNLYN